MSHSELILAIAYKLKLYRNGHPYCARNVKFIFFTFINGKYFVIII